MTRRRRRSRAAALRYDPGTDAAPRLVARGEGHIAERILEIARRAQVPIHENAAVVDVLARLELEREIPPPLYRVVAEILAFVFRVQAAAAGRVPPPSPADGPR